MPAKSTRQPLKVFTEEALDYFLLLETITVRDAAGRPIPGKAFVSDSERTYGFIPDAQWLPGRYSLQVAAVLEDLAGNNLNRAFDRDNSVKNSKREKEYYERTFDISDFVRQ